MEYEYRILTKSDGNYLNVPNDKEWVQMWCDENMRVFRKTIKPDITLTLTNVEAEIVAMVLGSLGGLPKGPRGITESVYNKLLESGVSYYPSDNKVQFTNGMYSDKIVPYINWKS